MSDSDLDAAIDNHIATLDIDSWAALSSDERDLLCRVLPPTPAGDVQRGAA